MTTPTDDFSGVTVAADKASYNPGDTITVSVSGNVVIPGEDTVTVNVTIADRNDNITGSSSLTVTVGDKVDAPAIIKAISDNHTPALTWTIAEDGLSATATFPAAV